MTDSTSLYREKPKQIEAKHFGGDTDALSVVLDWVQETYTWYDFFTPAPARGVTVQPSTGFMILVDSAGLPITVQKGDWVIKMPNGDFKKMSPTEFDATYEQISEGV